MLLLLRISLASQGLLCVHINFRTMSLTLMEVRVDLYLSLEYFSDIFFSVSMFLRSSRAAPIPVPRSGCVISQIYYVLM